MLPVLANEDNREWFFD